MGLRYAPYAFTEQGVAMLSSVLNSERAIEVNIQIMRIFYKMRRLILSHTELIERMDMLEKRLGIHDNNIKVLFEYLKNLMEDKEQQINQKKRKRIGFNQK